MRGIKGKDKNSDSCFSTNLRFDRIVDRRKEKFRIIPIPVQIFLNKKSGANFI
jgi:hypothetical protein